MMTNWWEKISYKDLLWQSSDEYRDMLENKLNYGSAQTGTKMNNSVPILSNKERKKLAKKWLKDPPSAFVKMDLSHASFIPPGMTRTFQNNRYIVTVYENWQTTHGPATKAMVQKIDNTPITFHWREMQKIKNELFGKDTWAVEYYPAEDKLLDTHNIYWLWIFPAGVLPLPAIT